MNIIIFFLPLDLKYPDYLHFSLLVANNEYEEIVLFDPLGHKENKNY